MVIINALSIMHISQLILVMGHRTKVFFCLYFPSQVFQVQSVNL